MGGLGRLIRSQPGVVRLSDCTIAILMGVFTAMMAGCGRETTERTIELKGAVKLVYEIDLAAAEKQGTSVDQAVMDKMVGAIDKRFNPSGVKEFIVRPIGTDRIEVTIPGIDPDRVQHAKGLIVKLGTLEFAIVASEHDDEALIGHAMRLRKNQNELATTTSDGERRIVAVWHELTDPTDKEDRWFGVGYRTVPRRDPGTGVEIEVPQVLVKHDPPNRAVTGSYLTKVSAVTDESGSLAVSFTLNSKGGALFTKLTGDNLPDPIDGSKRRLAILLDGKVHSAPTINSAIGANGQITGRFTKPEIDNLVAVLNAGALAAPLKQTPISEVTINPLLDTDGKK